jgi:5-methylcytosine-specific restriction endonuclease McrA
MATLHEKRVLVLNRLWQPIHICSPRRAIGLLCLGHAQVVDCDGEAIHGTHDFDSWLCLSLIRVDAQEASPAEHIRTTSTLLLMPSIIVLATYDRLPKREVKFTRENIFRRDDFTCQYCGQQKEAADLNIDHVIPRDKGGAHTWENVVCSCIPCNTRKGNKMPDKGHGTSPLRMPKAPLWRPLGAHCQFAPAAARDRRWSPFVRPPNSSVELSS